MAAIGLSWSRLDGRECIRVDGAHPAAVVRVWSAAVGAHDGLPPMAGSLARDGDSVVFIPRFGFVDGLSYDVTVDEVPLGRLDRAPGDAPATTEVLAIFPSCPVVPRNILRFSVWFSAPMSRGAAASHIRVVDVGGDELVGAIMPSDYELWDADRRVLTVLMDPARIKRGLLPHRELGYPLAVGGCVRLIVDERFPDARGAALSRPAERSYLVGPDERRLVDPRSWGIVPPRAATTDPLRVEFDRPLDHALLARCLRVVGTEGAALAGRSVTADAEGGWGFEPEQPWSPASHSLVVDPVLEDLAGNSLERIFDRDLERDPAGRTGPAVLPFDPVD